METESVEPLRHRQSQIRRLFTVHTGFFLFINLRVTDGRNGKNSTAQDRLSFVTAIALMAGAARMLLTTCRLTHGRVAKNGKGKAPVEAPKMGLGVARGGAVRIGGVGYTIGITEGIETALAVRQLVNEQTGITFPVWAALSANGMQSVEIPSKIFQVKIFPDHDQPTRFLFVGKPSVGMTAAKGLATRLQSEGVSVSIIAPARGTDWLDRLNAMRAA